MAEIHVERKRSAGVWLWVLLLVLLVVAAGVYLWQAGYINLGANFLDAAYLAVLESGGAYGA